jgi:hypothetical protein
MGYFFSAPTDRTNRVGDLARESHGVLQVIQRHQGPEGGGARVPWAHADAPVVYK